MSRARILVPLALAGAASAWAWHQAGSAPPPPPPPPGSCGGALTVEGGKNQGAGGCDPSSSARGGLTSPLASSFTPCSFQIKPSLGGAQGPGASCRSPQGQQSNPPSPPDPYVPRDAAGRPIYNGFPGGGLLDQALPRQVIALLDVATSDQVLLVDFTTSLPLAAIDLASGLPWQFTSSQHLALSDDDTTIAATNLGDGFGGVSNPPHVSFIDVSTRSLTGRLLLPDGTRPDDVVLSPDGDIAYVGATTAAPGTITPDNPRILVIDAARREILDELPLGDDEPGNMALTPDGVLLFVLVRSQAPGGGTGLVVIDTATRTIVRRIASTAADVLFRPGHAAASPDGTRIYVGPTVVSFTPERVDGVAVLDTQTLEWTANIPLGTQLRGISDERTDLEVSPDGTFVYLHDAQSSKIHVIDSRVNSTVSVLEMDENGVGPIFLAYPAQ